MLRQKKFLPSFPGFCSVPPQHRNQSCGSSEKKKRIFFSENTMADRFFWVFTRNLPSSYMQGPRKSLSLLSCHWAPSTGIVFQELGLRVSCVPDSPEVSNTHIREPESRPGQEEVRKLPALCTQINLLWLGKRHLPEKREIQGILGLHLYPVAVHLLCFSFPFSSPLTSIQDCVRRSCFLPFACIYFLELGDSFTIWRIQRQSHFPSPPC